MTIKAVDLFCGSGGLSAGLAGAGIDVVAAFDSWEVAINTYCRNLADHAEVLDLSDIKGAAEKVAGFSPDIIVGGPPCQDFSTAGKRVEAKQADLTNAFGRIVLENHPDFFLMENVPQVRLSQTYKRTKKMLTQGGYEIGEVVLNANLCGVPQSRRRFFAFGSRKAGFVGKWLLAVHERQSRRPLTVKEYMRGEIDIEHYYRHPRNYSRRSVFSVHEPSPTIRGVNRPVPPNYKGNHLDSVSPSSVRALTSSERSRIQTFPKSWDWGGGDRNSVVELQIGNAVPVKLAEFIGEGVHHAFRKRTRSLRTH